MEGAIRRVAVDSARQPSRLGSTWVGTVAGLCRLDGARGIPFDVQEALPSADGEMYGTVYSRVLTTKSHLISGNWKEWSSVPPALSFM